MLGCYVDEAGDDALFPTRPSKVPPVLCVLGLVLDLDYVRDFTHSFVDLKSRFFPGKYATCTRLERILTEVKGSSIRTAFRSDKPTQHVRRHSYIGFLDAVLGLLEKLECRIFGRLWVKPVGDPVAPGLNVYPYSIQYIATLFNRMLSTKEDLGVLLQDSRSKKEDREASFRVFTQKFSAKRDGYQRMVEAPAFGQSVNHAGIQACDLLCSALLFPMAAFTYCSGYHADPDYEILKKRYSIRLMNLQYRYYDKSRARHAGGITVSDEIKGRGGGHLFH